MKSLKQRVFIDTKAKFSLSKTDKDNIRTLRSKGMTFTRIAQRLGLPEKAVADCLGIHLQREDA